MAKRTSGNGWPSSTAQRRRGVSSTGLAFRQVQRQAGSVLSKLRRDIRAMESELARLKRDEEALERIAGRGGARTQGRRAPRAAGARGGGSGGRINWRNVLAQLPKQFKASNVRQARGLKDKRSSEIFAAITRWIEAGLAKRKTRGLYQKT